MIAHRRLWTALCAVAALPAAAAGQSTVDHAASVRACFRGIPASALSPSPASLLLYTPNDAPPMPDQVWRSVAAVGDSLGDVLRAALGIRPGELVVLAPAVTWLATERPSIVTATPDGRIRWSTRVDTSRLEAEEKAGLRLMAAAVDSAVARGIRFSWPSGLGADSVTFGLMLESQPAPPKPALPAGAYIQRVPLGLVGRPAESPVTMTRMGRLIYPKANREAGIRGVVTMQFDVDATGRVDPASIHEVGTGASAAGSAVDRVRHDRFVEAATRSVRESRFEPARVGGCATPSTARLPYTFATPD
jgi:hypothetical protein